MSVNREHKDRLFKKIFGRPEHRDWTLSLYNAVNGTAYDDPSQIEFNTMEDTLYMGMKNDVSFVLDMQLNLYGHQSTYNPNAPVRCLLYLGRLWSKYLLGEDKINIYGSKLIMLPAPKFVVFYNGTENEPDEMILRLSSAFTEDRREKADIELKVRMLNINCGRNKKMLDDCRPLYEYSWLIAAIREYKAGMEIEAAVDKALEEMPDDFCIKSFLVANREEVRMSILTEYDEERIMNCFKEEGREEGIKEGRKEGIKEGRKEGIKEGRKEGIKEGRKEGIKEGRKEGQILLVEVISRLNKGESREQILASGVDEKTLELAEGVVFGT